VQHRLRPAREHVEALQLAVGDENRVDDDLGARQEDGGFGVRVGAEPEHGGRRAAKGLGEVRKRREADAATDEERPLDIEPVAVAKRAEDVDLVSRLERAERLGAWTDGIQQKCELAGRRETERERPGQQAPRRLEHEELPRRARIERASLEPQERVEANRLAARDAKLLASRHRLPRPRSSLAARVCPRAAPTRSRARRRQRRTAW